MSDAPATPAFPRITVQGDKDGGWIVEVHDGVTCTTYSPTAETADDAGDAAAKEHGLVKDAGNWVKAEVQRAENALGMGASNVSDGAKSRATQ